ncbi:hypothetical protein Rsub_06201 [Raphidocelis subcapitata]|uniref:Uncharacterized protein n=1 Tax=Raphidocelis subcapitata TaxID=307507 RepID=A0A2V0P4W4_9CHLO|nr:hypothetical protein Rsub_06201 [Raphidocelis subcapitata]|eukprot:GBF93952.1 hypothetical protein Rsub_06201 [Raphidocelis subcapitata]
MPAASLRPPPASSSAPAPARRPSMSCGVQPMQSPPPGLSPVLREEALPGPALEAVAAALAAEPVALARLRLVCAAARCAVDAQLAAVAVHAAPPADGAADGLPPAAVARLAAARPRMRRLTLRVGGGGGCGGAGAARRPPAWAVPRCEAEAAEAGAAAWRDLGARVAALPPRAWAGLRVLCLESPDSPCWPGCAVPAALIAALARAAPGLESISGLAAAGAAPLEALAPLARPLRALRVAVCDAGGPSCGGGGTALADAAADALAALGSLTLLRVDDLTAGPGVLRRAAPRLRALERLETGSRDAAEGPLPLAACAALRQLRAGLRAQDQFGWTLALAVLDGAPMRGVTRLELHAAGGPLELGAAFLNRLAFALPGLRELSFEPGLRVGIGEGLLVPFAALTSLELAAFTGAAPLAAAAPNLERLALRAPAARQPAGQLLEGHPTLRQLVLLPGADGQGDEGGGAALGAAALHSLPALQALQLYNAALVTHHCSAAAPAERAAAVASWAAQLPPSVTDLTVGLPTSNGRRPGPAAASEGLCIDAAEALAALSATPAARRLRRLHLERCCVGPAAACAGALDCLARWPALEQLVLTFGSPKPADSRSGEGGDPRPFGAAVTTAHLEALLAPLPALAAARPPQAPLRVELRLPADGPLAAAVDWPRCEALMERHGDLLEISFWR